MTVPASSQPTPEPGYEIHEVAQLTGLTPTRLRAWERRYAVVRPERQPNGYRLYTAQQVALLRAFAALVQRGERIGDLVTRPQEDVIASAEAVYTEAGGGALGGLLAAIRALDRDGLEAQVAQQLSLLGLRRFAEDVVLHLAEAVGDLWALGKLPIAAEHMASEVLVHALKGGLRAGRTGGPLVVAACLPGERHEWGLLSALAIAQDEGWVVHYLGPDLPLDQVVEACWTLRPALVLLSASSPVRVEEALADLRSLPGRLPPRVPVGIGGSGVEPFEGPLREAGFRIGVEALTA